MENFTPNVIIPTSVCLTVYSGGPQRFMATPIDDIARQVVDGSLSIPIMTFSLDEIVEAHRAMDDSTAGAKIVVLV